MSLLECLRDEIRSIFASHKRIFVLSVLAFTCACIGINSSLTSLLHVMDEKTAAEARFGNKTTFALSLDGGTDTYNQVFSDENAGRAKALFEGLRRLPGVTLRYTTENLMEFFDPEDESYGKEDFPKFKEEFRVGYEDGTTIFDSSYLALKAFYVDPLFSQESGVALASGRFFDEAEYKVGSTEDIVLPVILGAGYRDLYELGDRIPNAHLGTLDKVTLEVVGFLEKGSYLYDNNVTKAYLDRFMVVPCVETAYDGLKADGTYDEFTCAAYDSLKIMSLRMICEDSDAAEVRASIEALLRECGFSEMRVSAESENAESFLRSVQESSLVSILVTGFVVSLIFVMILISTFYRILKDRKKLCILILNGVTLPRLVFQLLLETILVFLSSTGLYFVTKCALGGAGSMFDFGLSRHSVLCILAIQAMLLVMIGIYGVRKVRGIDMSSVLREHE